MKSNSAPPLSERPRERLLTLGAEALTTAELIAIILSSGSKGKSVYDISRNLVSKFDNLKNLTNATVVEILEVSGIGLAKALQLKAALTLGLRAAKNAMSPKYLVKHPAHAYNLVKDLLEHEKREHFVVILLDTKGYLIFTEIVSIGTLNQTIVHPREVFSPAIRHKAASIVVAHNHPSGDPTPSVRDVELTKELIAAGRLLQIPLNDHLIVGFESFYSLRSEKSTIFS